ncbi:MAG: ATP-binding protein [Pseudomonadota bacterium]|nr:ATP-binding protein [Pseudomonadota bacterium]
MASSPPELAARDERLYRLLESTSDGIFEVDADGRCTYCNATGASLLGFEPVELQGVFLHDAIHPGGKFLSSAECAICQAAKNAVGFEFGGPVRRTHGMLSHKDGRAMPVSYSVAQIVVDDGLQGYVMTFYDDAEHRRLAAALRDRTAELAESERRKTEFIATLAHELRNPLAPLRAALQIMRKASDDATSMAQLRAIMERQLGQLVYLVNDLLDIARVSSGQMTLQKERVALQDILESAMEASGPLRLTTNNAITLEGPIEPLFLQADATRLTQVFTNILNNAAQNSAAGAPITVRVESDGTQVRIDIADTGVGIAREALNRIFDMFTRVGRDAKSTHAGLGIGLNLARRLVELHDGQLVASSEGLGKGSHFLISLPLPEAALGEATTKAAPDEDSRTPGRALIVDDNVDAAVTLSLLLQLGGHTTALAHDGPEALKVAAQFKPDIVLLDLGLPGMDGYEVARALRRMPELGRPVLAAVTGWGSPEDRLRTKQAGFDEHLTKPVDISMIELLLTTRPLGRTGDDRSPPVENGHTLDAPPQ